jgi:cytochrome c-type biogenesis protein CcmH/NrfG
MQQKELDEASHHLRLAVQFKPDLYQANYILGQIAMAQEDYNPATKYYKNALRIQPDFERAKNELTNILEHQNKPIIKSTRERSSE